MAMTFPKTAYLAVQDISYQGNPAGVVVWNRSELEKIKAETVLNPALIKWVTEEPKPKRLRRTPTNGNS